MPKTTGRVDFHSMEKHIKLDKRDWNILEILSKDARIPLTRIAKQVRLSRDAVDYRIKRLEKEGVLLKTFANLNFEKLGYYIFHVFFLLDEIDKTKQNKLIDYLSNNPNIYRVTEYSDRWDLEIVLIAKNLKNFDRIILDISSQYPNLILEKDKVEIIRIYNSAQLPYKGKEVRILQESEEQSKLDEKDYKILEILSKDARTSTYEIGKQVKLSSDAVRYRMKRYLEEKIINNYTVLLNLSLLGFQWYTFTMEMKTFDHSNEKKFEEFLRQNPNIIRSAKTLGGWDVLLYIVVNNPKEYHTIIRDIKNLFAPVIRNYQTWLAYHEHVMKTMPEIIAKKN